MYAASPSLHHAFIIPGGGGVLGSGGDGQACGGEPLRPDLGPFSRQRPA